MKKWIFLSIASTFFSFSALSAAESTRAENMESNFFITHEQFLHLTNAEQKTYVKKVKEMVTEMGENFPYFMEEMSARSLFLQEFMNATLPSANAVNETYTEETVSNFIFYALNQARQYSQAIETASISGINKEEKSLIVENHRQAMYWTSVAASQAYTLKAETKDKMLKTLIEPAAKKVSSNEDKIKAIADEYEYAEARDVYFKKSLIGELPVVKSFPKGSLISYGDKLESSQTNSKPTESAAKPAGPASVKTEASTKAPVAAPTKEKVASNERTAETALYRCMYAGFIVKKDPCVAPRELPWDLEGLDSEKFKCTKGAVMCNPFVFGFKALCNWNKSLENGPLKSCWDDAKPYCVKPGLYATKNCTDLSNNDASLQAAVQLIKNNKAAFNRFGQSFTDLCFKGLIDFNSYPRKRTPQNIQRTKDDIKRTCDVAKKRMSEIEKRYSLVREEKRSVLKPSAKDLLKKPTLAPTGKDLLMVRPKGAK